MADIEIKVDGGTTTRLLTAGKYCDRDIVVTAEGGAPPYEGPYSVVPKADAQTLPVEGKQMAQDLTIQAIPFHSTENPSLGNTIYIGGGF